MKKLLLSLMVSLFLLPGVMAQTADSINTVQDGFTRSGYSTFYTSGVKVRNSTEIRQGVLFFDVTSVTTPRETVKVYLNIKSGSPASPEFILYAKSWNRAQDGNPVYADFEHVTEENGFYAMDTVDLTGYAVGDWCSFSSPELATYVNSKVNFGGGEVCFVVVAKDTQGSDIVFGSSVKDPGSDIMPAMTFEGAESTQGMATMISLDQSMYVGDNVDIEIGLKGTAPFTITYTDGTTEQTVTTSDVVYSMNVSPVETSTYTIKTITDANGDVMVINKAATITVLTQTAVLKSSGKLLLASELDSSFLNVKVMGELPVTFKLSDGNTHVIKTQNDTLIKVVPGETKVFRIIEASDAIKAVEPADVSGIVSLSLLTSTDVGSKPIIEDTYIEESKPTVNHDADTVLWARKGTDPGYTRNVFYQVDISDMTSAVDFSCISFAASKISGAKEIRATAVVEAVDVTTLTWETYQAGNHTEIDLGAFDMNEDSTMYQVDISGYVNAQIAAGNPNATIYLNASSIYLFASEHITHPEYHPVFHYEEVTLSSDDKNDVLSFDIPGKLTGPAIVDLSGNAISAEMDYGFDITSLTPVITVSAGATLEPASEVAQDFTNPVQYTVTSVSGIKRYYTATVTAYVPLEGKDILSWDFAEFDDERVNVRAADSKVYVSLPLESDPSALTATFTISDSATISPDPAVSTDYTNPVEYVVTSEAGTDMTWTVEVTVDTTLMLTPVIDGFVVSHANHAAKCFTSSEYGEAYTYANNWLKLKSNRSAEEELIDLRPSFMFFDLTQIDVDTISRVDLNMFYETSIFGWPEQEVNLQENTDVILYSLDFYFPRNPNECFSWETFPVIGWTELARTTVKVGDEKSYVTFSDQDLTDMVIANVDAQYDEMLFFATLDTTAVGHDSTLYFQGGTMANPPLLEVFKKATVVDPGNSVAEQELANLRVYPNPSSGILNVECEVEEAEYSIYNVLGSEILRGDLYRGNNELKIDELENGVYLFKYQSGNLVKTLRIVKK